MRRPLEKLEGRLARRPGTKSFPVKNVAILLAMLLQNVGKGVRT